jgi:hypothetical protein
MRTLNVAFGALAFILVPLSVTAQNLHDKPDKTDKNERPSLAGKMPVVGTDSFVNPDSSFGNPQEAVVIGDWMADPANDQNADVAQLNAKLSTGTLLIRAVLASAEGDNTGNGTPGQPPTDHNRFFILLEPRNATRVWHEVVIAYDRGPTTVRLNKTLAKKDTRVLGIVRGPKRYKGACSFLVVVEHERQ